jgi:phosphoribosylformimino-5-aminoimidazole carboxamide ribonucleotide (ProFAR) isomerase
MPDARRDRTPHKIRISVSGGIDDVRDIEELIKGERLAKVGSSTGIN